MNKSAIALLLLGLSSATAFADPTGLKLNVSCPQTNVIRDALTNFGSYVAASGSESIQNGDSVGIYFRSTESLPAKVPNELSSYANKSVQYDSVKGQITCNYVSSDFPALSVSYTLTNGIGATVVDSSNSSISLVLPVGFKR